MTPEEIRTRLERHISRDESGCWIWTGAVQSSGYSCIGIEGRVLLAHRVSYEAHRGPISEGLTIDHLCRVKRCVNPDHMEPVTARENNARRLAAQTHCSRGHELAGDNLLNTSRPGRRVCRECNREDQRARYERQKGSQVRSYTRHDPARGPVHGRVSTYTNHACRCDPCRAAGAEYYRARKSLSK